MKLYSLMFFVVLGSSYFLFDENKEARQFHVDTLTCTCDRQSDSLVLVAFHDALTISGNWINEWSFDDSLEEWYGIFLDTNGCVSGMLLNNNNLNGTIPSSIGSLCALNVIDFSTNFNITGAVPEEIGMLTELQFLNLWNTNLTGSVPDSFENLTGLKYLRIGSFDFEGDFPNEVFNMIGLQHLALKGGFSGTVPNGFSSFTQLKYLEITNTGFTGGIPNSLSLLDSLEELYLSSNKFTGTLPDLSNLELLKLDIQNNKIENIFNLSNIQTWESPPFIKNNKLSFEDIIPSISVFPSGAGWDYYSPQDSVYSDTVIYINQLGDDIIIDSGLDESLSFPNDYTWFKNGGQISSQFGDSLLISNVGPSDAGIYNFTATNIWNVPGLTLYSRDIHILENLPCQQSDSLELIKLYEATGGMDWSSQWNLSDPMPLWDGVYAPTGCVEKLDLSGRNLNGELPNLNLPNLKELKLNWNQLNGAIPSFESMLQLKCLYLNGNNFEASIPIFAGLDSLEILSVFDNPLLQDTLPDFALSALKELNFSNCSLTGSVPGLSACPNLKQLSLSHNNLTGDFPAFIHPLEWIHIDHNRLDQLSNNFNTDSLAGLYLNNNKFSDSIPDFNDVVTLSNLVLNNNNFSYLPNYGDHPFSIAFDQGLSVWNNNLSFDDIIPSLSPSTLSSFSYIPQDSFLRKTEVYIPINDSYTIYLGIDENILINQYQWLKNGDSLLTADENFLVLDDLDELTIDTFHCRVSNPNVPNLILNSRATIINICEVHEADMNQLLCDGESLTVNGTVYDQSLPEGTEYIDVPDKEGCDSIIHIQLDFHPKSEKIIVDTISEGSSIEFAGTTYDSTGIYEAILVGQGHTGCDSIIRLDLTVVPQDVILNQDFPNSFTPNGDGLNDYFVIPALQTQPQDFLNNEFMVFSRGNQILYQAKPYNNDWDGKSKQGEHLATGTYYYIFRYQDNNGQDILVKGKILLNR